MKINGLEIRGITCNSKLVKKGFVFVAIKGNSCDGNVFIEEAVKNKAGLIVFEGIHPSLRKVSKCYCEEHIRFAQCKLRDEANLSYCNKSGLLRPFPLSRTSGARNDTYGSSVFLRVPDARKFLAYACAEFYGLPSSDIKVTGVTGTNGKTTITYLMEAILKEEKSACGVIGTVNYRYRDLVFKAKNTTPGPVELQSLLAKMRQAGIKYCAMEASSHALDQQRVEGIKFASVIFTNLTLDHLDYHLTLEKYFLAKSKLFKDLDPRAFAVINCDDPYGRRLTKMTQAKVVSYALNRKAKIMADKINYSLSGTRFVLSYYGKTSIIESNLVGRHNVYNILAAIGWAIQEGIGINAIKRAIKKFVCVPGRMQRIEEAKEIKVFVDYAHTDDALFNVLSALRPLVKGRIILVFGCGGERDKSKRPKMGRVASNLADYAILTNDNPRSEDPLKIIEDIKKGMVGKNYCVIPERMEAIKAALMLAKRGDVVLVAGKGHENYQILKDKVVSFDDTKIIKKCLKLVN